MSIKSDRISWVYRRLSYRIALYLSAALIIFFFGFPFYWMIQNAFKSGDAILEGISLLPTLETFTTANFTYFLTGNVGIFIMNSAIVTLGTILLVTVVSMISGYGLSRYDFDGKVRFAQLLLFGYMFSPIALAIPLYLIYDTLGLVDTYIGLITALSTVSLPFAVWLMWKYMETIPRAYEEAAWVEGASRWRGFIDIIVPQSKPAVIATSLFSFAIAWNDFTFAQILMPTNSKTTFPPGIFRLVRASFEAGFGQIMAVSLMMTVPPLLFAYFLQSYILKGFEVRAQ